MEFNNCHTRLMKWLFTLVFLVTSTGVFAQHLNSFVDYREYFYIFDHGVSHQQEYQVVKSQKVGGNCLAYVDNLGKFKVYYDGEVKELERYNIGVYVTTEHLLVYKVSQELMVFDEGNIKSLVYHPAFFGVGDSVVAYLDRASRYLNVYYKGEIIKIADGLVAHAAKSLRVGDNTVGFVDDQDKLYLFYRGKIKELIYNPLNFKVSLNTAAYVDAMSGAFSIFHKGEDYEMETFTPTSYKMGDDIVAYVDESGSFKVFYNGEVTTISSFKPDFYKVIDDMVIYGEDGYFKVIYKMKEYSLENYIPQVYEADQATLAYIDQFGFLQCFFKGEIHSLSNEAVRDITVAGNTVAFKVGLNTNKVFYNGQIY